MSFENITYAVEDRAVVITINRPDKLNALNDQTIEELGRAIEEAAADSQAAAIIITGSGQKAFVAGADIKELAELQADPARECSHKGQALMDQIESCPKPVIAAVNGYALGGGCELALASHIRIASESAVMGLPEVSLGLIPGYGGTQRLPRIVGKGRALEMILTGDPIKAERAFQIGLVNKVVSQEELLDAAKKIAQKIASRGPVAVRYALDAVNQGLRSGQDAGMDQEAALFGLLAATEDMKEGTKAFLEKRTAEWKNR